MQKLRIMTLERYRQTHDIDKKVPVKAFMEPVDDQKYLTSAIGRQVEVPDNIEAICVTRGRDAVGQYFKFWYRVKEKT